MLRDPQSHKSDFPQSSFVEGRTQKHKGHGKSSNIFLK